MGVLCAFATTLTLLIGAELNGVAIAGIFTITGFGSFGKHLKNIIPVIAGALIAAYFNRWDFVSPANVAAILFSSGLAPIAGQFGPVWGVIAGLLHVNVAMYAGTLSDGINLYSNGFAACFVAMFLLPLATEFKKS
jgi:MFS family permease